MGCAIGDAWSDTTFSKVKNRLELSDLFLQVDLIPHNRLDRVDLIVIVKEPFYLFVSDAGYVSYDRLYGNPKIWWTARLGVMNKNFRGRMETLKLGFSLWESRSIGLTWGKKIVGTPWSGSFGFLF
jgi:hypothetical protein